MVNSEKIKARAKQFGVRKRDLANAMGVKQSTASQKINNVRPMSLNEAEIIARALKISDVEFASYFFSGDMEAGEKKKGDFAMEKEKALDVAVELAKAAISIRPLPFNVRRGYEIGGDVADFIEALTKRLMEI